MLAVIAPRSLLVCAKKPAAFLRLHYLTLAVNLSYRSNNGQRKMLPTFVALVTALMLLLLLLATLGVMEWSSLIHHQSVI